MITLDMVSGFDDGLSRMLVDRLGMYMFSWDSDGNQTMKDSKVHMFEACAKPNGHVTH